MISELGELIELPSGMRLYYVDEDHSYWRCHPDGRRGRRLSGVTTVISPLDADYRSRERLLRWAARSNGEGIARLAAKALELEDAEDMRLALSWLENAESIWAALEEQKLTFEDLREAAATRGTNVHVLALQALAEGKAVPEFDLMSDEERGFTRGVVRFWLDHEPDPLDVEQVVADEDLGVAGTFDLRCRLKTRMGIGVIDLKTGHWISERDHAQIAGYRHLAELCGVGESDWGAILQVNAEGRYQLIECQASAEDFLASLRAYRTQARIRAAAAKARKAREERAPA